MSYICKDCPGWPDFLSQYNKENHRGQCHANVTRCKDASGTPHELQRQQPSGLFYCPTCGIGGDVANAIRPHVSKCKDPSGSGEGRNMGKMGGYATPTDSRISKITGSKTSSASPSPGPSPSSNANASSSRPAKVAAPKSTLSLQFATESDSDDDDERERKEKAEAEKEKDRLEMEKKRAKAREESRKKEGEREEERERTRKLSKPKPVELPTGPRPPSLPSFKRKPAEQPSTTGQNPSEGSSSKDSNEKKTLPPAPASRPPSAITSGSNFSYPPPPPPHRPKLSADLPRGSSDQPRLEPPLPNRTSRLDSADDLDSFNNPPPVVQPLPQVPPVDFTQPITVNNPPSTTHSTYPSGLPLSNPNRRLPPPAKSSLKRAPITQPSIPAAPLHPLTPSADQPIVYSGPFSSVTATFAANRVPKPQPTASSSSSRPTAAQPQPQQHQVQPPTSVSHNAFEIAEQMYLRSGLPSQVGQFTLGKTPEEGKKLRKAVLKLLRSLKPKKPKEVKVVVPPAPSSSVVGVAPKAVLPPSNTHPRPLVWQPVVTLPPFNPALLPPPLPVPSTSNSTPEVVPAFRLPGFIPSVLVHPPLPPVVMESSVNNAFVAPPPEGSVKRPRGKEEAVDPSIAKKPVVKKERVVVDC